MEGGRRRGERNRTGKGEWMVPAEEKQRSYLFFLPGFGLGPGSDISHTSSSRGEKDFLLWLGEPDVRFGPVPHFALGPIADVSNSTSPGGDPFVFRMNDVDGWLDIRGREFRNVGVTTPSCRTSGRATITHSKDVTRSASPSGMSGRGKGRSLTG